MQKNRTKKRHIYIYTPEDLDNDDIVSMVDMSPTYKRDTATLEGICSKTLAEPEEFGNDSTDDSSRTITF
ncbi:MAG: hypothetical protein RR319_09270 [Bacteroides sp.]